MTFLKNLTAAFACVLLVTLSVSACVSAVDRAECGGFNMNQIYKVVAFSITTGGRVPHCPKNEQIEIGTYMSRGLLRCPAVWQSGAAADSITYLDLQGTSGSVDFHSMAKYPIAYDSSQSNHGGGVFVLTLDGSRFWDREARWLKRFAQKHPEIGIVPP